jgi:hypothetical protein
MVYMLGERERQAPPLELLQRLRGVEGVELLAWQQNGEACVWSAAGELRFAPGSSYGDLRGERWDVEGVHSTLELERDGDELRSEVYPNALARFWGALRSGSTGDVLVSASPGYEFIDWGGASHVGGGSHGSLRAEDSRVPLVFYGCGPDLDDRGNERRQWTIQDVAPIVLSHFGVDGDGR